jgi:chorismate dehydratase
MIFGTIEYLNLLPFYIFVQKNVRNSQFKQIMNYQKGVPSYINKLFETKKVDFAFISSIKSANFNCSSLGIISNKEVWSVIVKKGENLKDSDSETSNKLAEILNIKGQVIIGDKALKIYFNKDNSKNKNNNNIIISDLSLEWYKKYKLPFVFAKLCFHKKRKFIKNLSKKFYRPYIPFYIQKKYIRKIGITRIQMLEYLNKIDFICNNKSKKSFKLFKSSS